MNEKWSNQLRSLGAMWQYQGRPEEPHAVLTSGKHSDVFFNISRLLEHPVLVEVAVADLLQLMSVWKQNTRFVGPEKGAITIAHEFGRQTKNTFAFSEKDGDGMAMKRFAVADDEIVLPVEDVFTTGKSSVANVSAALRSGGILGDVLLTVVNRSGESVFLYAPHGKLLGIIALVTVTVNTWEPHECPLCKKGSLALKPKKHWEKFTQ